MSSPSPDRYALSKTELIILESIYDWEYRPYLTIPEQEILKARPEFQERKRYSPVPVILLDCIFAAAHLDVYVAIAGLIKQGLVEQPEGYKLQGGRWHLPDNRVIHFEWNTEDEQEHRKRIGEQGKYSEKSVDVIVQIEGDYYSQRAVRFGRDSALPCYTLTREGLVLGRRLFEKQARPNSELAPMEELPRGSDATLPKTLPDAQKWVAHNEVIPTHVSSMPLLTKLAKKHPEIRRKAAREDKIRLNKKRIKFVYDICRIIFLVNSNI
jgi:hypothetical protein